jgi:hypothetical protein
MATRHPNHRRVKLHRTYAVEDLALLFGVHKNTVRNWVKSGLDPVDDRRPLLFRGETIVRFLRDRRDAAKIPCEPGTIYCLPCRSRRRPAGDMVEYVPRSTASGNLRGICPVCDRFMHRSVAHGRIRDVMPDLDVIIAQAERTLSER